MRHGAHDDDAACNLEYWSRRWSSSSPTQHFRVIQAHNRSPNSRRTHALISTRTRRVCRPPRRPHSACARLAHTRMHHILHTALISRPARAHARMRADISPSRPMLYSLSLPPRYLSVSMSCVRVLLGHRIMQFYPHNCAPRPARR